MYIAVIILFCISIIEETVCHFKKKQSQVLLDMPILCKLPLASIFICYFIINLMVLTIGIGKGAFLYFFSPILLYLGLFVALIYNLYKAFFYKKIMVNQVKKEIVEEALYTIFEKYKYTLEERIKEDERKLLVKNIGVAIVLKENKNGECTHIELSKYKKIESLEEILNDMKGLLIEKYKVNKDFHVTKMDFLLPIILYGISIIGFIYFKK